MTDKLPDTLSGGAIDSAILPHKRQLPFKAIRCGNKIVDMAPFWALVNIPICKQFHFGTLC